ncbi:hypothetical protein KY290_035011 [Solanum tuberosum]|uniref:Uncharacterized protein n=1 Tax=Solanum tuberosum TaxID=4113 RepID=A0ABQ7U638_SOLTU|nr:hypothetical protein KY289_034525 [Solanum tuberosum]KAH0646325.1 hypothetical protein KY284_034209 [Solanum tuberosum]KAH0649037.1 hypothetical protein KY285_034285 [Solanum tuberosum]KAH0741968.1 hypothetical protein KY290_035011 [Solanum tuberosum]
MGRVEGEGDTISWNGITKVLAEGRGWNISTFLICNKFILGRSGCKENSLWKMVILARCVYQQ